MYISCTCKRIIDIEWLWLEHACGTGLYVLEQSDQEQASARRDGGEGGAGVRGYGAPWPLTWPAAQGCKDLSENIKTTKNHTRTWLRLAWGGGGVATFDKTDNKYLTNSNDPTHACVRKGDSLAIAKRKLLCVDSMVGFDTNLCAFYCVEDRELIVTENMATSLLILQHSHSTGWSRKWLDLLAFWTQLSLFKDELFFVVVFFFQCSQSYGQACSMFPSCR